MSAWWGPAESIEELRQDFLEGEPEGRATKAYVAAHMGRPIGFIQRYYVMGSGDGWWEDETDPTALGIDQFLADPADLGKGMGRAMVRSFVANLFATSEASFVQTDPSPSNERAIRCYIAAGFAPVGTAVTPDGPALLLKFHRPPSAGAA